ncbi:MAG: glycosyltransferase family 2 protein [Flavobacteriales bacterium]
MKVSVILTTYNSERNLKVSLPSVFAQTGLGKDFEFEIIAIDNCSQDGTLEVLRSYGIEPLINEKNSGGPNKGRNRGLDLATGDVICFLDDDDAWHPDKTRMQLSAIGSAPIVTSSYLTLEQASGRETVRGSRSGEVKLYSRNQTFLNKLKGEKGIQYHYMSTIMIDASLRHVKFEEYFGKHDFDWLLRLFENQVSAQIEEVLVTRHVHDSNLSRTSLFRVMDYHFALLTLEDYTARYPKESELGSERLNATRAKYHYELGQMKDARRFFVRSQWEIKNALYYLTTFAGSAWVKRKYMVFG